MKPRLEFKVLGPFEVTRDGTTLAAGGPKQRCVLAMLALSANRVVAVQRLVDTVWGDAAHGRAPSTLQVYVANLRKLLEPDRSAREGYEVLVTRSPGYLLAAAPDSVDLLSFERLVAQGRHVLAEGDPGRAAACLRQALDLWRGEPLADLAGGEILSGESTRLDEMRLAAMTSLIEAELAAGLHADLVGSLEKLTADHPFNETFRAQLMLALYRSGRQAEALRAFADTRAVLVAELGIEPGTQLRSLEAAMLRQDPALDALPGSSLTPVTGIDPDADGQAIVPTRRVEPGSSGLAALTLPDGSRHVLGGSPCTIGRVSESCLTVLDEDVSRRHAVIRPVTGGFLLTDLGSTNGTTVNGSAITDHLLEPGDEVTVGSTSLRYEPL